MEITIKTTLKDYMNELEKTAIKLNNCPDEDIPTHLLRIHYLERQIFGMHGRYSKRNAFKEGK